MSNYKSIHFYEPKVFARNDYFKLFGKDLKPIFQYLADSETGYKYFFVRYKDELGPHIRIRIRELDDNRLNELLELDGRIKISEYLPEYNRYGGPEFISFSEALFEETSALIKELFTENPAWIYENSILFSITLNYLIIKANTIENVEGILENSIDFWIDQTFPNDPTDYRSQLFETYQKGKEVFMKNFSFIQNQLEKRVKSSDHFFFYEKLEGISIKQKELVVESIIHMTNNRFGIYNIDEPLINYYLLMCLKHE